MQIDFHFYTIYALARSAGFKPNDAHIIAYSSQYTDDSKYEHALGFENGGRFQQVLTGHRFNLSALTKSTCYRIWIPFHFLPGNLGGNFYERMITRQNSVVAQRMIDSFLSLPLKPYSLQHLGIILHTYSDTWSHQNFMGIVHNMNDVKNVKVENKSSIEGWILESLAPKIGHTQVGTIPDEPYRKWEYEDYKGYSFQISNYERALDASQHCYEVLLKFLSRFPVFSHSPPLSWQNILQGIGGLFANAKGLDERVNAWEESIKQGKIFEVYEEDTILSYDDREWFKEAVTVIKEEREERYIRNEGFERSHFKHFHDAASLHLFCLLNEILPEYGIICG